MTCREDEAEAAAEVSDAKVEEEAEVAAVEEDEEDAECAICLLELGEAGEGNETLVGCQHTFHTRCITEWKDTCRRKKLTVACPYCCAPIRV